MGGHFFLRAIVVNKGLVAVETLYSSRAAEVYPQRPFLLSNVHKKALSSKH
jgi:hypothetical protein